MTTSLASGGRRSIVVMAAVAVVCLAAGVGLSQLITSPGRAAANAAPPTPGDITVPVERRVIGNVVVLRGDVGYDDPVELRVETGEIDGRAVVTGQVPEVGATLDAASVALEVVGRPVIVLPGELPTYRTLRSGVSGPDVQQLKEALRSIGIDGGDPADARYDSAAAAGVRALYQKVGYEPPSAGEEADETAKAARSAVTAAREAVASAERALSQAAKGTGGSSVTELDGQVQVAEARLAHLREQCAAPPPADPADAPAVDCSRPAFVEAETAVSTARAARGAADARPDTSAEAAAVRSARDQLSEARSDLAEAEAALLTPLPSTEVVFVPTLPRRVDDVDVRRGGTLSGAFMSVSGATIQVSASASRADADLLPPGTAGTITFDGTEIPVTVSEVTDAEDTAADDGAGASAAPGDGSGDPGGAARSDRRTVRFTLGEVTPEQVAALQGSNVRVHVPVSSTDGEVLAVPLAALTAGPGGESRVEISDGEGTTRLVTVTTGLAASGYVEITGSESPLEEGDLVVVGIAEQDEGDTATDAEEPAGSEDEG